MTWVKPRRGDRGGTRYHEKDVSQCAGRTKKRYETTKQGKEDGVPLPCEKEVSQRGTPRGVWLHFQMCLFVYPH
jgi:hypothetical protein